jgi:nicotinate dehydrogenase subunit B
MIPNTLPESLIDNPRLDRWFCFENGKVRVSTGKVELGQGVLTALAQIAAEELDVDISRITMVSGETPSTPNEGWTASSISIEVAGSALRLAGAEVRALFLQQAAQELHVDASQLDVADGTVLNSGKPEALDYWKLAPRVNLARDATGSAPAKSPDRYKIVGRSTPRLDLPAKITGEAFIHDVVLPGMMHARVVRRPRRGACAVIDTNELGRLAGKAELFREGDFIAVLADDESVAQTAADFLAAKIEWLGGIATPDEAPEPGWLRSLAAVERETGNGRDLPRGGGKMLRAEYSRPFLAHGSIAPSCALAKFESGRLSVYTHSQAVFMLRAALAQVLKIDVSIIDVYHRQGAGCYGHNGADDVAFDAALIALRKPGVPIRVLWTRADELGAAPTSTAMTIDIEADLDSNNRVSAWTTHVWSGPHAQRPGIGGPNLLGAEALPDPLPLPTPVDIPDQMGAGALRNAIALYDLPQKVVSHFIPHMPVRTSSMRGLGALANVFAIECFMDELAEAAGEDPVAYRLSLLSDPRARRVIETAARLGQWTAPPADGRAKGFAFSRYKNRAAYLALIAEVTVEDSVTVNKIWCATDAGLVINPDGLLNQIEGGIVQAVSWTLQEEVRFAEGRVASVDWDSYPILRFSEVPEIEIELVGDPTDPALGSGEVALGPTAAAIGNAVARALGTRIRRLPLSRERLTSALLADS